LPMRECIGVFFQRTESLIRRTVCSAHAANQIAVRRESTPGRHEGLKMQRMTQSRSKSGFYVGPLRTSELPLDPGWSLSTLTVRKELRSLRNLLRRMVHPLRHSLARQDEAFTLYTSYALIRLRFGLRPVARSTSAARADSSLLRPAGTSLAELINGSGNARSQSSRNG
jgi:hypothetical protein